MSNKNQTDPRKSFVQLVLPWLLGAVMLVVYLCTLNHWITLLNLEPVARASGLMWQPELFGPLSHLVVLPFTCLPAAAVPHALNFFAAICAALVLVLLARSVALLPHDRTQAQRERERSDFSFLTGWPAFFPPIMAVLFAGLQLTFWQHATSFTGEMFDLLLFAVITWLLLEYRLNEKPSWLAAATVVFGAAVTESWAFVGFIPVFITALIWIKGVEFFNLRFLGRTFLCGLAGLLFFLLLPLLAKFSGSKFGIWDLMRPSLHTDWTVISALRVSEFRHNVAEATLSTLLPVLVMAIRWSANLGDSSKIGSAFANNMIHVGYAAVFTVCVWGTFDPPFSAGQLLKTPSLTLGYLGALSLGYFCGYFLLVFGKKPVPTRRNSRPAPLLPRSIMWICTVVVAGTFVAAGTSLGILLYRNVPLIQELHNDVLLKFAQASTQNLPPGKAVLLCDSDSPNQDQPIRSLIIQAMLAREGRSHDFTVVDTELAYLGSYNKYLHTRHPDSWPSVHGDPMNTNADLVSPLALYEQVISVSKSNTLCYLNPSYGYYFEHFYQEPHGLIYQMKTISDETLLPPEVSPDLIAHNEEFWNQTTEAIRPAVLHALNAPDASPPDNFPNWVLAHLHATPVVNEDAIWVGVEASRGLDDWGVRLQRAGKIKEAGVRFATATDLNPDNVVAGINLKFNQTLRSNAPVQVGPISADQFGKYRNWNDVINANGPFDEISFTFENGVQFKHNRFYHQAAQEFNRVRQLIPHNLDARLELAQIYLMFRMPDRALEALADPLGNRAAFGLNETNATSMDILGASIYFQKDDVKEASRLLDFELAAHPSEDSLQGVVAQTYFIRGMYPKALHIINERLSQEPNSPQWLFAKGVASLQSSDYKEAITALTRVVEIQTNNPNARFDRALAYLKSDQLEEARADYHQLQLAFTNSYIVAYGLGDIAERQHDTNEAIRNFQIYTASAPTNSPEYTNVLDRLTHLRGK